jgi:S1-C subfamily serine protease
MSCRTVLLITLIAAVPAAAQQPAAQTMVRGEYPSPAIASIPRAVVGIVVNTDVDTDDQRGYPITAITPGSPADRAGLRPGDYVTQVNGQPLTSPAVQLWLLQSRLSPDDTIAIQYRRGDSRRTVHLVPTVVNQPSTMWAVTELHRAESRLPRDRTGMPESWEGPSFAIQLINPRSPLAQLELAPLNDDLGRYFGTSDGVLVINVPDQSSLGLLGGDVVLKVDGRRPDSPSNLIRILRTYAPDDSIRFEIVRLHKHRIVVGQIR